MSSKNDMDTELRDIRFIELVRDNPILYGKPSGVYDKSKKRATIWKTIAKQMNFSDDQTSKKWRYLRDKYVKEKRKLKSSNTDESNPDIRLWPLYNHLKFLSKHVRNRSNGTLINDDTKRDMDFIQLVEENPILYNKTSVSYTNTNKRAAIWSEIACKMNFSEGDEAHKKWRYLRDKYVKYKRAINNYDPSMNEDFEVWPLYKNLSFLSQHVRKRRAITDYITSDDVNEKTESNIYDNDNENQDDHFQEQTENYNEGEFEYDINEIELSNSSINQNNDNYNIDNCVEYEMELPTDNIQHPTVEEIDEELTSDHIISPDEDPLIEYDEIIDESQEFVEHSNEILVEKEIKQINKFDNDNDTKIRQQHTTENNYYTNSVDSKDAAFCAYVAHEMKEMSKKDKNLLKCMITNFINEKNTE